MNSNIPIIEEFEIKEKDRGETYTFWDVRFKLNETKKEYLMSIILEAEPEKIWVQGNLYVKMTKSKNWTSLNVEDSYWRDHIFEQCIHYISRYLQEKSHFLETVNYKEYINKDFKPVDYGYKANIILGGNEND